MKKLIILPLFLSISINVYAQSPFPNYKVNLPTANQPNEVSIAVNPVNPNYIAAGSNLYYLYVSSNAGITWTQKQMSSVWKVWGDPCLIYDANGNLFYGHLSDQRNVGSGYWIDRMVVQRSTDNGTTWGYDASIGFNPPARQQDKEWLAADLTNSVYRNNIYMAWTEFDKYGSSNPADSTRILFSRSTDSGFSWSMPVRISERGGDCLDSDNTVEGCVPAVGP
ncbi:MAG: glycosyl hydrolase, partial [Ignavibacteriae bacterium HGW-Ignavibacteriae-3]